MHSGNTLLVEFNIASARIENIGVNPWGLAGSTTPRFQTSLTPLIESA